MLASFCCNFDGIFKTILIVPKFLIAQLVGKTYHYYVTVARSGDG